MLAAPVAHAQSMDGMDHGAMDHSAMDHEAAPAMDHDANAMTGALGPYPMSREASGTAWQPDAAAHGGVHAMAGEWMVMSHLLLNGVYTDASGPRGDSKSFLAGMAMASARRDFAGGQALNLRAMVSPDPFMGKRGYPLLLAAGETADGATPLVDRQHPHELVMELSGSLMQPIGADGAAYLYAGLPGEPAFGPPAFMHRASAKDFPIAPITHHWLDSTHITFGVLTAGYSRGPWKIETSRFRGREPDERRFDVEEPKLDSTSARLSWNPTANLALQASWAEVESPEQLHPATNETRYALSALYSKTFESGAVLSTTLAWGRKRHGPGETFDGLLAESALAITPAVTLFARAEQIETEELAHALPAQTVRKYALGALHDWNVAERARLGVGAVASFDDAPAALGYGDNPRGGMIFVRLRVD